MGRLQGPPKINAHGECFGGWLKGKAGDGGPIGRLASLVAKDRRFSVEDTPWMLGKLLDADRAPTGLHRALDQAAIAWLAP